MSLRAGVSVALVASCVAVMSCQSLLGIHTGGRDDAGSADVNAHPDAFGDARMDSSPSDRPGDEGTLGDLALPGDAAGESPVDAGGAEGGDGGHLSDGPAGDGNGGADVPADGARPDAADGGSASDAADAVGPADASGADGGRCAPAWSVKDVEARVFVPPSTMTACSLPPSAVPVLAAGLDATAFRGAQACGACLRVQGGAGTVVVQVVERSATAGVILTRAAMDQLSAGAGLIRVDYQLVACDTMNQPLRYFVKEGSNAGYVGIQVRNARYPVMSVSSVGSTTLMPLTLQPYNYWESTTAGAGPLTLRVTDINGQVVEDTGIAIAPQTETAGKGQFPVCQ